MAPDRMKSVSNQLKKVISEIIRELKDPRVNSFVSVTSVEVSRDLRSSRVRVSCLDDQKKNAEAAEGLNNAHGFIRRRLMQEMTLKRMPALFFIADDSIAEGVRVCRLIDDLRAEDPPEDPEEVDAPDAGEEDSAEDEE